MLTNHHVSLINRDTRKIIKLKIVHEMVSMSCTARARVTKHVRSARNNGNDFKAFFFDAAAKRLKID